VPPVLRLLDEPLLLARLVPVNVAGHAGDTLTADGR
jgi:hypothetical protein